VIGPRGSVSLVDASSARFPTTSHVWVARRLLNRRSDVVLFVNGIPLVLAGFKEPNRFAMLVAAGWIPAFAWFSSR
jgi:hypothetical protein